MLTRWGRKKSAKQPYGQNADQKDRKKSAKQPYGANADRREQKKSARVPYESSPNLCVNSSSSYVSSSMLLLSSEDLIEWSLVSHSTLSYQKFCD